MTKPKEKNFLTSLKDCTSATNEEFSCLRNIYGGMRYVGKYVAEKQTSHNFKLFRDYPNSACYLKKGILAGAGERRTRSSSGRDGRIYPLAIPVPK